MPDVSHLPGLFNINGKLIPVSFKLSFKLIDRLLKPI